MAQTAIAVGVAGIGHGNASCATEARCRGEQGCVDRARAFQSAQCAACQGNVAGGAIPSEAAAGVLAESKSNDRALSARKCAHITADDNGRACGRDAEIDQIVGIGTVCIGVTCGVDKCAVGHADTARCGAVAVGCVGGCVADTADSRPVAEGATCDGHIGRGEVAGRGAERESQESRVTCMQCGACYHAAADGYRGTNRIDGKCQCASGTVGVASSVNHSTCSHLDAASGCTVAVGCEGACVNESCGIGFEVGQSAATDGQAVRCKARGEFAQRRGDGCALPCQ